METIFAIIALTAILGFIVIVISRDRRPVESPQTPEQLHSEVLDSLDPLFRRAIELHPTFWVPVDYAKLADDLGLASPYTAECLYTAARTAYRDALQKRNASLNDKQSHDAMTLAQYGIYVDATGRVLDATAAVAEGIILLDTYAAAADIAIETASVGIEAGAEIADIGIESIADFFG